MATDVLTIPAATQAAQEPPVQRPVQQNDPAAFVLQQEQAVVRIPLWVTDLASFRRWARSDDFPTRGWYAHLNGELWADPNMERLVHNRLKTKIGVALSLLVTEAKTGEFLGDRMLLTNEAVSLSTEPDGMFLSYESLQSGRVRLDEGDDSLEVEGSPDMVLEVVSPTSRQKDTIVLRDLYWRAGIREYWLAEPGRDAVTFNILHRGRKGYTATRRREGWLASAVFGRSFRLTRSVNGAGLPAFNLEVR